MPLCSLAVNSLNLQDFGVNVSSALSVHQWATVWS